MVIGRSHLYLCVRSYIGCDTICCIWNFIWTSVIHSSCYNTNFYVQIKTAENYSSNTNEIVIVLVYYFITVAGFVYFHYCTKWFLFGCSRTVTCFISSYPEMIMSSSNFSQFNALIGQSCRIIYDFNVSKGISCRKAPFWVVEVQSQNISKYFLKVDFEISYILESSIYLNCISCLKDFA